MGFRSPDKRSAIRESKIRLIAKSAKKGWGRGRRGAIYRALFVLTRRREAAKEQSSLPFKGRAGVGMGLSGIRGQRSGIRKTSRGDAKERSPLPLAGEGWGRGRRGAIYRALFVLTRRREAAKERTFLPLQGEG